MNTESCLVFTNFNKAFERIKIWSFTSSVILSCLYPSVHLQSGSLLKKFWVKVDPNHPPSSFITNHYSKSYPNLNTNSL